MIFNSCVGVCNCWFEGFNPAAIVGLGFFSAAVLVWLNLGFREF